MGRREGAWPAGRRLAGTPCAMPGCTRLRRTERKLADACASTSKRLVASRRSASDTGDDVVLQIAELPDIIRGYESIKEANIAAYRARLAELLAVAEPRATACSASSSGVALNFFWI